MSFRPAARIVFLLMVLAVAAGCGAAGTGTALPAGTAASTTTSAPATAAPVSPTVRPAATPTRRATATAGATAAPTGTPAGEAATTTASETVTLLWAPEAPLVDSDDIEEIIAALMVRPGILAGTGSEVSISITYDPAMISAGRIIVIMRNMGYPVLRP